MTDLEKEEALVAPIIAHLRGPMRVLASMVQYGSKWDAEASTESGHVEATAERLVQRLKEAQDMAAEAGVSFPKVLVLAAVAQGTNVPELEYPANQPWV